MKKLLGILFALLIFAAPLAMNAEIEATAGSMKIGVHMDFTYRWSGESNKDPESDEIGWKGYDTFSAGDLFIEVTGKVGDRISYKILEGLVYADWVPDIDSESANGLILSMMPEPMTTYGGLFVAPIEAYVDFKVIDQFKARFGKFIVPTLIANTGVHQADVIHTANPPLIANRGMGFNEFLVDYFMGFFPKVSLPLDVTGAGLIGTPLDGLQVEFFVYDEWVNGEDYPDDGGLDVWTQDLGFDYNRTKGWDLAATYNRDILGGKLTARGFYFSEYLDWNNISYLPTTNGRNNGWGIGAMYDHNLWFVGAEYTADTLSYAEKPEAIDKKSNTWNGYYILVGGRFMGGTIQPVYRFDWIDYSSLKKDDILTISIPEITSFDNEMWHTIGVNWLVNDNATVGINYVIKQPERLKFDGDRWKYPNINEIIVMMELDLL